MCDETLLLRFHRLPPLTAVLAQNNAKSHLTATFLSVPTTQTKYRSQTEILFLSLAVLLDFLKKVAFTAHAVHVIAVSRYPCFEIDPLKKRAKNAEDSRFAASKLVESLQNKQ